MERFLQPLGTLDAPMIINARTGQSVASGVEIATTRRARRRGLLGRDGLNAGCAFVLSPCWAVHTIGMRFAIDVVFVDAEGQIVKIVENLSGWKMAASMAAMTTIELWAGAVQAMDVHVGDRLALVSAFADHRSPISAIGEDLKSPSLGVRPEVRRPQPVATPAPQPVAGSRQRGRDDERPAREDDDRRRSLVA